tara:strand:+ start:204 stop:1640 length:1437 start_codon:yes stop_codon:yes gene_type:complete
MRYFLLILSLAFSTVTDIDGNVYETVLIDEQLWMAENLKVTRYSDGDAISTNLDWSSTVEGGYTVYPVDYDDASQATCEDDCSEVYGNLYNRYAVDDERGVCPEGWHIPTDDEFKDLERYLGMTESEVNSLGWRGTDEGSQLAGNANLWQNENSSLELTNEFGTSGYNALPAGRLWISSNHFGNIGAEIGLWLQNSNDINSRYLDYLNQGIWRGQFNENQYLQSIRCISNEVTTGCTHPQACNYNPEAYIDDGSCLYFDCAGICGGSSVWDNCQTCDSDASNDCEADCNGEWGGDAVVDACGECDGNGVAEACVCEDTSGLNLDGCCDDVVADCYGYCGGNSQLDECGECIGHWEESECTQDCAGEWGGTAETDNCGVCDSDASNDCEADCNGEFGGDAVVDACGECDGNTNIFNECAELGDVNQDDIINILDVVTGVYIILDIIEYTNYQQYLLDYNQDGETNILDILALVNYILAE